MNIEMYTKTYCPYCVKAKELLKNKGVSVIKEYNVETDTEKFTEMLTRSSNRRTVPQKFINNKHIGGCDDLYALNDAGKLDELLK